MYLRLKSCRLALGHRWFCVSECGRAPFSPLFVTGGAGAGVFKGEAVVCC